MHIIQNLNMFGKSAPTAAGKQYANAFANMDDGEDEFQDDDYGSNYYDEEDQSMEEALLRQQLLQQQKLAAMGQQKAPAYSGPGSQPIGANLFGAGGGAGQFGSGIMNFGQGLNQGAQLGGTQFGGTQFGGTGLTSGGGGGFTYGMASAGGPSFGSSAPQQSIAKPQSTIGGITAPKPAAGGFQFGQASQFGGIGGGAGMFGSGQATTFGAGNIGAGPVANDPYANVDLDLSKVKKVAIPSKPFEKKSEEEKVDEKNKSLSSKSNLKTTKEDFEKASNSKKEVRFGKSITYQVEGDSEPSMLSENNVKKIIDEKDLSDGRDEKQKIQAMIDAENAQQLEEMRIMNEWKAKQAAKNAEPPKPPVQTKVPVVDIEESAQSSSQASSQKNVVADSYTSDDFEDTSMSGSGQSNQPTPVSKLPTVQSLSNAKKTGPVAKPLKKIEESSDIYEDDDFESLSRSQQQMNQVLPIKKVSPLPTVPKQQTVVVSAPPVRKENQNTMTDLGKYNYSSDPTSGALTLKEMSLKRQLDDSEMIAQEQRITIQKQRDENKELELKLRQKDTEFQGQRREALNAQESSNRMQEQLKELQHRCNLYRVETEELIRQIDVADAKTREREDQLTLKEAEFDRKLRAQEERILFRRGKSEEREILDVKREHSIQLEELMRKYEIMREENDYLNTKVTKLEQSNKEIRLAKDPNDSVKKLEGEIQYLQQQLAQFQKQDPNKYKADNTNIKKELSHAEQIRIQKELAQVDIIIKGYQDENHKADQKLRELTIQAKQKDKEIVDLKRQVHDFQIKKMLVSEKVYVEEVNQEVDLQTANVMGPANSISQKQLKELQDTIVSLRADNDNLKRDWNLKEQQLKSLCQKIRDEKGQLEKQMYQLEYLVQEKNAEISKLKDEFIRERGHLEEKIKELSDKVAWFRQNQSLLTDQAQQIQCQQKEINDLKSALKRSEDERLKQKDIEKKCKLLEETLKAKNPNAVPQLIQAVQNQNQATADNQNEKQLKFRIQQLEGELDERDKDFERRIRTLRQEQERMRQIYEDRTKNPTEARKVNELEEEVSKTKTYYQKRIRELEDKYKFKVNIGKMEGGLSDLVDEPVKANRNQEVKTPVQLEATIIQMTEDRNMLVQRLHASQQKIETLQTEIKRLESQQEQVATSKNQSESQNVNNKVDSADQSRPQSSAPNTKLNPFFIEETPKEDRSVAVIMKILMAQQQNLSKYANKQIKISEFKSLMKGQVSESELKKISQFLNDQKLQDFDESVSINNNQGQQFIDVNDLLDHLGAQSPGSCSPSQQASIEKEPRGNNAAYQDLKREFNRLQREKEDDTDFFNQKIRQLKRQLQQATVEKEEAEEFSRQLEAQKTRLEKFLKQGISKGGSADDLMQDVNFVMKRLEMLEQQAEERAQLFSGDQAPLKRKVEVLQQQLLEEKAIREKVVQKKNSEVAYFKKELQSLLDEIAQKSSKSAVAY